MNYRSFELISNTNYELENEIAFCVASARAEGVELVKLIFSNDRHRFIAMAQKKLRALKRQGRVEFFEMSENLLSDTTEARFFRNKYKEFVELCSSEASVIVIKI